MTKLKLSSYATRCSFFPSCFSLCFEENNFPISLLRKHALLHQGFGMEAQCSLPTGPRPHRWRSYRRPELEEVSPTADRVPWAWGGRLSGDCPAGCEEKPGLDSRPANKLVAICIPFHDSAVLMKGSTVSEEKEARQPGRRHSRGNCGDDRVIEIKVQGQLLEAAAASQGQEENVLFKEQSFMRKFIFVYTMKHHVTKQDRSTLLGSQRRR